MKRNLLLLTHLVVIGSVVTLSAQNNSSDPGNLPPGLQKREQLPPGLEKRNQLPPGLQRRQNQAQLPTNSVTGQQQAQQGTLNQGTAAQTQGTLNQGTGSVNQATTTIGTTNQQLVGGTLTNATGLPQTGYATNRLYATNSLSISNQTSLTVQDQAYTPADRQVLVQIRRAVQPLLGELGQVSQVPGSAWMPVHFVVRDRVVSLVGMVMSEEQSQQIETTVTQIPGVVRVVNRLQVNSEMQVGSAQGQTDATGVGGAVDAGLGGQVSGQQTNAATGLGSRSNVFGMSQTNSVTGTNTITPTGTNNNRIYSTNEFRGTNNLSPTGRSNNRAYPNDGTRGEFELPPGLEKRDQLPPGLRKRDELPPGLRNREGDQDKD